MKIDKDSPHVNPDRKEGHGELLESIIDVMGSSEEKLAQDSAELAKIEDNVDKALKAFKTNCNNTLDEHLKSYGAVHGETKEDIGLGNKDNFPAGTIEEQIEGVRNDVFCTPAGLALMLENHLRIEPENYLQEGMFPISLGTLLGKAKSKTVDPDKTKNIQKVKNFGSNYHLFSTEDEFLLFPDMCSGRATQYGRGGLSSPIATTGIKVINDKLNIFRGRPFSLNDLTIGKGYVTAERFPRFGFGNENGNFYNSNFKEGAPDIDPNISSGQNMESTQFDPMIVYTTHTPYVFRSMNSVEHDFDELVMNEDVKLPIDHANFLSQDGNIIIFSNPTIEKNSMGGLNLLFYITIGSYTDSDLIDYNVSKFSNKTFFRESKMDLLNIKTLTLGGTGVENPDPKFTRSKRVSIPLSVFFNDNIDIDIDSIDMDHLALMSTCWVSRIAAMGYVRFPLCWRAGDKLYLKYLDFSFDAGYEDSKNITFSLERFSNELTKSAIKSGVPLGGTFFEYPLDVGEDVFHPTVFNGCLLNTGGHVKVYNINQRQYVCYYKHNIKNIKQWIEENPRPTVLKEQIKDISVFPTHGLLGEHIRLVPLAVKGNNYIYHAVVRNRTNGYQGVIGELSTEATLNNLNYTHRWENVKWLKVGESINPSFLVEFKNNEKRVNTSALVFTQQTDYIGYTSYTIEGTDIKFTEGYRINQGLRVETRALLKGSKVNELYFLLDGHLFFYLTSTSGESKGKAIVGIWPKVKIDGVQREITKNPDTTKQFRTFTVGTNYPDLNTIGTTPYSYQDVYVTQKDGDTYTVMLPTWGYPNLYLPFKMVRNTSGGSIVPLAGGLWEKEYPFYYNSTSASFNVDITKWTSPGKRIPHNFFPAFLPPIAIAGDLKIPSTSVYSIFNINTGIVENKLYQGFGKDIPLYFVGGLFVNKGRSINNQYSICLENDKKNFGKVFVTEKGNDYVAYTKTNNPEGFDTEPNLATTFMGYYYEYQNKIAFSYFPPGDMTVFADDIWINALLPVIDSKQLSPYANGSTIGVELGRYGTDEMRNFYYNGDRIYKRAELTTTHPKLFRTKETGTVTLRVMNMSDNVFDQEGATFSFRATNGNISITNVTKVGEGVWRATTVPNAVGWVKVIATRTMGGQTVDLPNCNQLDIQVVNPPELILSYGILTTDGKRLQEEKNQISRATLKLISQAGTPLNMNVDIQAGNSGIIRPGSLIHQSTGVYVKDFTGLKQGSSIVRAVMGSNDNGLAVGSQVPGTGTPTIYVDPPPYITSYGNLHRETLQSGSYKLTTYLNDFNQSNTPGLKVKGILVKNMRLTGQTSGDRKVSAISHYPWGKAPIVIELASPMPEGVDPGYLVFSKSRQIKLKFGKVRWYKNDTSPWANYPTGDPRRPDDRSVLLAGEPGEGGFAAGWYDPSKPGESGQWSYGFNYFNTPPQRPETIRFF